MTFSLWAHGETHTHTRTYTHKHESWKCNKGPNELAMAVIKIWQGILFTICNKTDTH